MTYPPSPNEPTMPYPEYGPGSGYPQGYGSPYSPGYSGAGGYGGYGDHGGYSGYGGGYPPYPPSGYPTSPPGGGPPPPHNTRWVVLIIVAVVAVVAATAVAVWQFSDSDSASTAASTSATTVTGSPATTTTATTTAPTTTSSTPSKPLSSTCDEHAAGPGPQTPEGWATVNTPRGLVYDVPPEWVIKSCSTLIGWEKPCDDGPFGYCPIRTMSGASEWPDPGCQSEQFAVAGAPGASNAESIDEAVRIESSLVADIFTSADGVVPTVSLSEPRQLSIGDTPAVEIVATVSDVGPGECSSSPGGLHLMLATTVPGQPGSVMFVVSMRQGGPGDPDPALADQLVDTLRFAG
ncbi:hypothetical protein [Mycobacterium sp. 1274756.6]|uniref:hypothetical protein n=1 Tax=Mycobacterium sp. 1274756.6 TaxID=1834076 RepID=UPI0009EE9BBA|nr:hypothetical protein [Mycobacterium sp. 1274756.6]